MIEPLIQFAQTHREAIYLLLRRYFSENRTFLLQSDLRRVFQAFCEETERGDLEGSPLCDAVRYMEEAILVEPWAYFTLRESVGIWHYIRIHFEHLAPERIEVGDY